MGPLPYPPDGPPGEPRADLDDGSELRSRDELDLGRAVDVDELDEEIFDTVGEELVFEVSIEPWRPDASWSDSSISGSSPDCWRQGRPSH